jgi:LytS/YehU family sensor histidine kinase
VCVTAQRREGFVELTVENPCDPDRPPSRGTGVGLVNVRSRVETLCGQRASVDVQATEENFRVSILLPAVIAQTGAASAGMRSSDRPLASSA